MSQSKRQAQLPSVVPGRFMRWLPSRPSTSCIGKIAIAATELLAAWIIRQWQSASCACR